jgi:hypothetical protein
MSNSLLGANTMQAIRYYLIKLGLHLLYLAPIIPLAMLGELLEKREGYKDSLALIAVTTLVYLVVATYLAHKTAHHMAFDDQPFSSALKSALFDLRLLLAYLPLVGNWFAPASDKRQDDDDDAG